MPFLANRNAELLCIVHGILFIKERNAVPAHQQYLGGEGAT